MFDEIEEENAEVSAVEIYHEEEWRNVENAQFDQQEDREVEYAS